MDEIAHSKAFESVNWGEDRDTITTEVDMLQREVLHHGVQGRLLKWKA